jgi:hypothetical protein
VAAASRLATVAHAAKQAITVASETNSGRVARPAQNSQF